MRTLLISLIAMSACGHPDDAENGAGAGIGEQPRDVDTATEDSTIHASDLAFVATISDLPTCDASREGEILYVKESTAFHGCHAGAWETLNLQGPSGKDGVDGADGMNGTNGANGKTAHVRDAEGNDLGLLVSAAWNQLILVSSKGYIYSILWDGTPVAQTSLYYSSSDCTGSPRAIATAGMSYGKVIHADRSGNLFAPLELDAHGNVSGTAFAHNSFYSYTNDHCYIGNSGSVDAVELIPISRSDAGIPTSIAPKISIVNE